ncbi:acyltransferase [Pedobacter sp. Leaf132]|uniref:acyltransferase family protein n=1 Tax=Pedobacter sp. Leaf132 TaxID=2876557 RepID=UPI001E50AD47|nr:acyltransferase [Pedobacter sp. Leaf132]
MHLKSFEESYNSKDNAIGFIRLILAVFVIVQHSYVLLGSVDPLSRIGLISFGALGVNGFFILSGFLITSSWLNSTSITNYVWRRILRIFPAFLVCLLVTAFIITPLIIILKGQSLSQNILSQMLGYIFRNALLIINQPDIANLTAQLREKSLNGSLWTLSWEFLFYILLAIGGIFGVLSKRKWVLIIFTLFYIACYWIDECKCTFFLKFYTNANVAILPYYFLVGSIGFLFKKHIPDSKILFAICTALWLLDLKYNPHYPLHPFFLLYILLWLTTHLPIKSVERFGDFSYGLYIYHFVVIQTILISFSHEFKPIILFLITLPIAFGLAYLSWNLIEKRCMNFKRLVK